MVLQAIRYGRGDLSIIDQLKLPHVEKYINVRTSEEGWHAIKDMRVRGAPAIAIVAALSLACELHDLMSINKLSTNVEDVQVFIREKLQFLVSSRPTAVNLSDAARKLEDQVKIHAETAGSTGHGVATAFIHAAESMLAKDLEDNRKIGENGAQWILKNAVLRDSMATVLTHCNTGYVVNNL